MLVPCNWEYQETLQSHVSNIRYVRRRWVTDDYLSLTIQCCLICNASLVANVKFRIIIAFHRCSSVSSSLDSMCWVWEMEKIDWNGEMDFPDSFKCSSEGQLFPYNCCDVEQEEGIPVNRVTLSEESKDEVSASNRCIDQNLICIWTICSQSVYSILLRNVNPYKL